MSDVTASGDWFEDDSVSFDEAMARFERLGPEPTTGPLLAGAVVAKVPATVSGAVETVWPETPQPAGLSISRRPATV